MVPAAAEEVAEVVAAAEGLRSSEGLAVSDGWVRVCVGWVRWVVSVGFAVPAGFAPALAGFAAGFAPCFGHFSLLLFSS